MHEIGHIWDTAIGIGNERTSESSAAASANRIGGMRRFLHLWFAYIDESGEHGPYTFKYSNASWIDKDNKIVYVMNYTCSPDNLHGLNGVVGQVSHEMGHAFFDAPASLAGSRDAFVKRMCTDEGRAVLNNWRARSEILNTSEETVEIPLIASNASQLQAIILAGGEKLDERVGSSFRDNNTNSLTGENYRTFYGKWYDENVGVQSLFGTEV